MLRPSLYQIGPVQIDTKRLTVDAVDRQTGADFAAHDLLGRMRGRESVGEGDETLTIRGVIITIRPDLNGMPELDKLHGSRKAGEPVWVHRGDGVVLGWYVVESIGEQHEHLQRDGVGAVVRHEIKLTKVAETGSAYGNQRIDPNYSMLNTLITLFGA